MDTQNWPGTTPQHWMLSDAIGHFLRTHKGGWKLLLNALDSVPSDRTEAEYQAQKAALARAHEAGIQAAVEDYSQRRVASGLPPVDRHPNVIAGAT